MLANWSPESFDESSFLLQHPALTVKFNNWMQKVVASLCATCMWRFFQVSLSTNSAVFFPEEGESSPDGWYWHLGGRSSGITFFLELLSSSALTNKVRRISIRGTGLKRYFIVLYIFLETVSFS
uniref:Uncharacterized protein n=1 Tax=Schistocephalus solidus TaxID=70667 RepID=A0A0X3PH99_SCHSO